MARFGWAYVDCATVSSSSHDGPTGSLQFITGSGQTSGSSNLIFEDSSSTLFLTGTLVVSGTIKALELDIITTVRTEISTSGSTQFGDTDDDTHSFSGSLEVVSGTTQMFAIDASTKQTYVMGLKAGYTQVTTTPYDVLVSDFIIGVTGSGTMILTLPSASVAGPGTLFIIKDENLTRVSPIVVSASSGDLIEGDIDFPVSGSGPAINVYSNGIDQWFVF